MNASDKLCPVITAGALSAQPPVSPIVTPGTPPPEPAAIPCAGAQCAWWITQVDPATGKVVGGACQEVIKATALSQQTGAQLLLVEKISQLDTLSKLQAQIDELKKNQPAISSKG